MHLSGLNLASGFPHRTTGRGSVGRVSTDNGSDELAGEWSWQGVFIALDDGKRKWGLIVVFYVGNGSTWILGSARETRVCCEVCKSMLGSSFND